MRYYFSRRARRAETARVDRFLHAIELSARYAVNPEWDLSPVPDETQALPLGLAPLLVPVR
jgi:hypothetical protein